MRGKFVKTDAAVVWTLRHYSDLKNNETGVALETDSASD